jgi:cold shock CspA family protein/transposase-like protein
MPSKIQTSEWPAIAARREKGDSVAAIARDYGVSAASIYGILKQHKEGAGGEAEAPEAAAETAAPEPPPAPPPKPVPAPPPAVAAAPAPRQSQLKLDVGANAKLDIGANGSSHAPASTARREPEERQKPRRGTALDARLDQELRQEVDAAIADFQAAFSAALAAANPETVEHLRRAASDLMRAGARTTIVVERLGAVAPPPRPSAPTPAPAPAASAVSAPPAPPRGESGEAEEASSGTVKWFNTSKGFGFVKLDEAGADVFVHAQALQRAGIPTLQEGQRVRLTARPGPKGPQADWIALEG